MSDKEQQVVPRGGRWAVRSTGAQRVAGYYLTEAEAIGVARARAAAKGGVLFIYGTDGQIRMREAFGASQTPAKG